MFKRIAIGVVVTSLMVGCSDPKDATESNFKAATQTFLDKKYPFCYFKMNMPAVEKYGTDLKELRALAEAGLLVESETDLEIPSFGGEKKYRQVPQFNLTDEGKKYYIEDAGKTMMGNPYGGFCFGKATVEEIVNFTDPADMFGHTISRVNYSYKVTDIPEWASSETVTAFSKDLKESVASEDTPINQVDAFIRTNNGWVHEKLFGK
jgi:hypothetical protein